MCKKKCVYSGSSCQRQRGIRIRVRKVLHINVLHSFVTSIWKSYSVKTKWIFVGQNVRINFCFKNHQRKWVEENVFEMKYLIHQIFILISILQVHLQRDFTILRAVFVLSFKHFYSHFPHRTIEFRFYSHGCFEFPLKMFPMQTFNYV